MIFVTGGTGFLGRYLLAVLCRAGHRVRVLTRHPEQHDWLADFPHFEVVRGDTTDAEAMMRLIKGCRYVIHAAGLFRFWGDDRDFMQTNVTGTENVLAAAKANDVKRVVLISTVAVIGQPHPTDVMDETYPARPADPYQQSKLDSEAVGLRYNNEYDLPVVILRAGAFYGPLGDYAFNRLFFRDPMRGIMMQLDGGNYIQFPVYIEDVADASLLALTKGIAGEIYNVTGAWISHREVFDIVTEAANLWWPRLKIPGWLGIRSAQMLEILSTLTGREPFWPINLRSYVYNNWRISNEKARHNLGFEPTPFKTGAIRTVDWYRAGRPDTVPEVRCDPLPRD